MTEKMSVLSTKNYDQFKTILGNRLTNYDHIRRLVREITTKNLLATCPIIVNEKMEVIDGQHRLEAAKLLGEKIYYVIVEGLTIRQVVRLNGSQSPWGNLGAHEEENDSMNGERNRVFRWSDPEKGLTDPITAFPDKLIPGLHCPDCGEPACETDQVGVALCTGTPGWFFYYRQVTDGLGKPETKQKMINGELQEVTEYNPVKVERQPDGEFKELKGDE